MIHEPRITLFAAWVGLLVSQINLTYSDYVVIVGAVGFALSSLRTGRMKVLRDTNKDLTVRNNQLEQAAIFAQHRITALEAQPNLETHAVLLEKLVQRLEHHDQAMKRIGDKQAQVWDHVIGLLVEIRDNGRPTSLRD